MALPDGNHAHGLAASPAKACLRRRPEVRSQNARIGGAAGGSALVTLRDCAASAWVRLGDGDGTGVGAAGGGLNCANFGIFPVNLCN
mgnify:CR=1 FL=1